MKESSIKTRMISLVAFMSAMLALEGWLGLGCVSSKIEVVTTALAILAALVIGAMTIRSVMVAAAATSESEKRYRTLFESSHDALLILRGTTVTDCNLKAVEMFGGDRGQLVGMSLSGLSADVQADGKPTADQVGTHSKAALEGRHQLFEWRHKRLDGSHFETEVSLDRIELEGEIVLQAIIRDVTERKKGERNLMESENRFRALFEQAAVGVAELDPHSGRFLRVNKRYCDILGLSMDEMLNTDFQSITYPDDLDADLKNMRSLIAGEITEFSMEKRCIRKNGEIVWISLTVSPVWHTGEKPTTHLAVVEDITERKNAENALRYSEEKFSKAFHATPSAIAISRAADGLLLEVNEAFSRMMEYSREEVLGQTTAELGLWADPQEHTRSRAQMLEHGSVRDVEGVFRTKSGKLLDGLMFGESLLLGKELYLLTVVRDITEWKKADAEVRNYRLHLEELVNERTEELRAANEKLKELDRLKSMFIASMSHELRTPLNAIIGFTGITLQGIPGALNDQQKDNLSRVNRAAKHLLSLIDDLIDISKIEAGRVESNPEAVALDSIVDEAIGAVTPQLKEKGLDLIAEIPRIVLTTDRKRLLQCLLNLLSNAVKYTEAGTVTVAARETDGEVEVSVTDTGIGIAENDQPKVFKPFERFNGSLRVKAGGTGLGLYLTGKIAREILHGDVTFRSKEGEGSVFTVTVPKEL